MNWIDLFDEDAEADRAYYRSLSKRELSGVCDDDCEAICPFIGILPDESDHEEGSPLSFKEQISAHEMDRRIQKAFRFGIPRNEQALNIPIKQRMQNREHDNANEQS